MQRKSYYSDYKQLLHHKDQQNNNNKEREMERKTIVLLFQVTNWQNLTREN